MSEHNRKEAERIRDESRRQSRVRANQISEQKVEHRAAMKRQAKIHSLLIEKKKQQLKEADMLVVGMREMFAEMLDEMQANRQQTRHAQKAAEQLKSRATSLQKRLSKWKGKCNRLCDEIRDEQKKATDSCVKADEYEAIIDVLEADFEIRDDEYSSIIQLMDEYYENAIAQLSPRSIGKHWVKNKDRGKHGCLI